jgi:hypothetical protein
MEINNLCGKCRKEDEQAREKRDTTAQQSSAEITTTTKITVRVVIYERKEISVKWIHKTVEKNEKERARIKDKIVKERENDGRYALFHSPRIPFKCDYRKNGKITRINTD